MEIIVCSSERHVLPDLSFFTGLFDIRICKVQSLRISEIRNAGLEVAKGEVFLLLDSDCLVPSEDLIQEILERSRDERYLHGGGYGLSPDSPYFPSVYNTVNNIWQRSGVEQDQSTLHLLGGFMFGSGKLAKQLRFSNAICWGGEEKELLRRLKSEYQIHGKYHEDLQVTHLDNSGFKKFCKRSFFQGFAAGQFSLTGKVCLSRASIPVKIWPGLVLFYFFSRLGIFVGRFFRFKGTSIKP